MTNWLTMREAAEHIRAKDDRKIRAAVKAGELPASDYGGSMRLKADDVDAWLEGKPWEPRR